MTRAYYNENDPKAVAWLRELIKAGLIAPGDVDDRSITNVQPQDLEGYTQCHFFAGIGGWSYALRLASWADDRPVWTGSCPCQPFSAAGKQQGAKDPRHLWPEFARLIRVGKPANVFGEQVASKLGREWLAGVRTDLEAMGYAVGAADLCAAGVGAPHIRQRLYWVADTNYTERRSIRSERYDTAGETAEWDQGDCNAGERRAVGGLAHPDGRHPENGELQRSREHGQRPQDSYASGVGDADQPGPQGRGVRLIECPYQWPPGQANLAVLCTDGKARRFEPGSFPLAHGIPARMGRLRGYGNAIVPQVAAEFIRAYLECRA